MNSLCSQVPEVEFSEGICSDGKPSVPLNGNPIPQAYLPQDKMTKFSRLSRFGMTFGHLTESRGEELLTLYRAGFPAKTLAPQETAQESPALDQDSGLKWQGLLGKYDHGTRSWKTAQCSLLEDLEQSLEIWPRWGLMRDGASYQQQTLVRRTSEKESGLWHTPMASDGNKLDCTLPAIYRRMEKKQEIGLAMEVRLFPTVTAKANQLAPSMQSRYANPIWPTPTLRDYKGMRGAGAQERKGNPTDTLPNMIGGSLNPTWVEWLMGWPLGWTDLKPLGMDKFQEWRQQHLN